MSLLCSILSLHQCVGWPVRFRSTSLMQDGVFMLIMSNVFLLNAKHFCITKGKKRMWAMVIFLPLYLSLLWATANNVLISMMKSKQLCVLKEHTKLLCEVRRGWECEARPMNHQGVAASRLLGYGICLLCNVACRRQCLSQFPSSLPGFFFFFSRCWLRKHGQGNCYQKSIREDPSGKQLEMELPD